MAAAVILNFTKCDITPFSEPQLMCTLNLTHAPSLATEI